MATKARIKVYASPTSDEVVAQFKSIEELEDWVGDQLIRGTTIFADQVSVNNMVLLGWDELYDFI